jgi:3-phenylpropionate/cinnamic acid dioxygenase small subunit
VRSAGSIEDRVAIVDVTFAYAWALDMKQWDELTDVFLPDATAELSSPMLHGVEAIQQRVASALTLLDASQHLISNHQVEVDGDTARCRCQLSAQHVRRGVEGGETFIVGGRYEDDLVRTPAGWRIRHRKLTIEWREGNAAVMFPPK